MCIECKNCDCGTEYCDDFCPCMEMKDIPTDLENNKKD